MNRTTRHILVSIVCIAAVFAAIAVAVDEATPDESQPDDVYDIEYDLNGGVQNPANPMTYVEGEAVDFRFPFSTEGLYFGGWYSDSDFEQLCMSLEAGHQGDVSLYAKWQSEPVNLRCSFAITTDVVCDFDLRMDQVYTYTVHGFHDGYAYVEMVVDDSEDFDMSAVYWNSGTKVVGNETIPTFNGERLCDIVVCGDFEDRYWIDSEYGWTYKIVSPSEQPEAISTLTLQSVGFVEAPETMVLTVEAESGIASSSGGEYGTMSEVELSAQVPEGKVFGGWYDGYDNLISEEPVCRYNVLWNDETVYAKYADGYTHVLTEPASYIILENENQDITWELFRNDDTSVKQGSGNKVEFDFDNTGYYHVVIDDPSSECREFVDIKVEIVPEILSFEWVYGGVAYSYSMNADHAHFLECGEYLKDTRDQGYIPENDRALVLYDDPYVDEIVEMLMSKTAGFSDEDRVNMVMRFVQAPCIPYNLDSFVSDTQVYNKTAYETLFLGTGECYDTSILLATILHGMGYDCAVFTFSGHAAVGVALEGFQGEGLIKDGVKYFYCETTSEGWEVGYELPDLDPIFVTVI